MCTIPGASILRWKKTGATGQARRPPARRGVRPRGALRARACWEVPFAGPAAAPPLDAGLGPTGPLLPAEGPWLVGRPREMLRCCGDLLRTLSPPPFLLRRADEPSLRSSRSSGTLRTTRSIGCLQSGQVLFCLRQRRMQVEQKRWKHRAT